MRVVRGGFKRPACRTAGEAQVVCERAGRGTMATSMVDGGSAVLRLVAWRCVAATALLLGSVGLLLPIMPTVPFLIVAAWAASRGWPSLEQRLLYHPTFGPSLRAWRERRAVPRRAKWLASVVMTGSAMLTILLPVPLAVKLAVPACLAVVCGWLWFRPDG